MHHAQAEVRRKAARTLRKQKQVQVLVPVLVLLPVQVPVLMQVLVLVLVPVLVLVLVPVRTVRRCLVVVANLWWRCWQMRLPEEACWVYCCLCQVVLVAQVCVLCQHQCWTDVW